MVEHTPASSERIASSIRMLALNEKNPEIHPQMIVACQFSGVLTVEAKISDTISHTTPTSETKNPLPRFLPAKNLNNKSLHAEKNIHAKAQKTAIKIIPVKKLQLTADNIQPIAIFSTLQCFMLQIYFFQS